MLRKAIFSVLLLFIMGFSVIAGQIIENKPVSDVKLETDAGLKYINEKFTLSGYWSQVDYETTKVDYETTKYITTTLQSTTTTVQTTSKTTTAKKVTTKKTTAKKAAGAVALKANSRADEIIAYAKSFLGTPYVRGGSSPSGFDCSGYVQYVLKKFNINLGRTGTEQYNSSTKIKRSELKPGDLVFFSTNGKNISHVGIYLGNNNFIHSSSPGDVVKISQMATGYYNKYYYGASRY